MNWVVHVDGGARGNPGPAGAGIVVTNPEGEAVLEAGFFLGTQTNNAAEYLGLIMALRNLPQAAENIRVIADSELMVKQLTGEYRVKSPTLQPLFEQAQMLLVPLTGWTIQHVKRHDNTRADELANMAMDRRATVVVTGELRDAAKGSDGDGDDVDGPLFTQRPQPAEIASPVTAATDEIEVETPLEGATRLVQVCVLDAPDAETCPAGGCPAQFLIGATLPAGICVHAAHALLTTVIAIQNTDAGDFAAIPPMTVRCSHRECQASFQVSPVLGENGRH